MRMQWEKSVIIYNAAAEEEENVCTREGEGVDEGEGRGGAGGREKAGGVQGGAPDSSPKLLKHNTRKPICFPVKAGTRAFPRC